MNVRKVRPLKDPRTKPTFQPAFMPLCDFDDPPTSSPLGRNDSIRFEFLSVYYELNATSAQLLAIDQGRSSESRRSQVQARIEKLSLLRDRLEDQYAPLGIIAEPEVQEGFVVNLSFTFPDESRWLREQKRTVNWQANLSFSPPPTEDVKEKESGR